VQHRILIVDNEVRLAEVLAAALAHIGYRTDAFGSAKEALEAIDKEAADLVISDMRMPEMSGRQLLNEIKRRGPDVPVIIMTAYTSVRDAVELVKEGAFDYVSKPFETDDIATAVARALKLSDVVRDNKRLRGELERRYRFDQLIGTSAPFRQVIELITKVCESRATVLLSGESGTGKELVARAIHFNSPRQDQPFIAVNCAAIPEGLLESELFGHAKGAFTGAASSRIGRFKAADGGTIFLDEIGDMPAATQAKILRVLQERIFEPVGSTRSEQVDVRIIAATHKDLRQLVAAGNFREDLYYRLNVFPIVIPSLRERSDDIPLIAAHFLDQLANETGKRIVNFTPSAMAAMTAYAWPGNIRELMNCIERAVIVSRGSTIDVPELPPYLFDENEKPAQARTIPSDLDTELTRIEREYILHALNQTGGIQIKAAELLGISERSLWYRLKKLKIDLVTRASH
jgi:two-component system response regulator AtoC